MGWVAIADLENSGAKNGGKNRQNKAGELYMFLDKIVSFVSPKSRARLVHFRDGVKWKETWVIT